MKKNKSLIMLVFAFMASAMFAAEATTTDKVGNVAKAVVETAKAVENTAKVVTEATGKPAETPTQESKAAPVVPQVDYKDAFLGLVLEKAQKYSGAAENAIGGAVDMAKAAVTKGYDLAAQEAPKLLEEFLMWRFIQNLVWFVIPFILFGISLYICLRNFPKWIDSFRADQAGEWSSKFREVDAKQVKHGLAGWFGLVASILLGVTCLSNTDYLMTAIQIKVAPRVYVVEQAIDLYKVVKKK